jgi:hypothetical protein
LLRGRTCPERLLDKSEKAYWNLVRRPDISGVHNRAVWFKKLDTPVLTRQNYEELYEKLEELRDLREILR